MKRASPYSVMKRASLWLCGLQTELVESIIRDHLHIISYVKHNIHLSHLQFDQTKTTRQGMLQVVYLQALNAQQTGRVI